MGLRDRSVVVTGASRGIGRGIADAFLAEGAKVTVVARTSAEIEATGSELRAAHPGSSVLAIAADITDGTDAVRIVEEARAAQGGLDILVNNAGGTVREGSIEERWDGSFGLNVTATVRLMELAKPYLAASGQGAVVNIASIYGREYGPGAPAQYSGTKAAEIAMSKAYALTWAPEGIRVNSVAPGSVAFEGGSWGRRLQQDPEGMAKFIADYIPGGRFGRVEEIAATVVFLASPRASWILGACVNVDGGQSKSGI